MTLHVRFVVAMVAACLPAAVPAQDWVAKSNANAQVLLDVMARFNPEFAGQMGVEGVDEEVIDLRQGLDERTEAAVTEAVRELETRLAEAEHPTPTCRPL